MAFKKDRSMTMAKLRVSIIAFDRWASFAMGAGWLLAYWLVKPDLSLLAVGTSFLALSVSIAAYDRTPAQ